MSSAGLREIRRVLRAGGRVALAFTPRLGAAESRGDGAAVVPPASRTRAWRSCAAASAPWPESADDADASHAAAGASGRLVMAAGIVATDLALWCKAGQCARRRFAVKAIDPGAPPPV